VIKPLPRGAYELPEVNPFSEDARPIILGLSKDAVLCLTRRLLCFDRLSMNGFFAHVKSIMAP
jgi:hypothetical protein